MNNKKELKILSTIGMQNVKCHDLELVIGLLVNDFWGKEDFIVFEEKQGKTEIHNGDGMEEGKLAVVDKVLFNETVWAVYGNDGKVEYFTIMLPSEY